MLILFVPFTFNDGLGAGTGNARAEATALPSSFDEVEALEEQISVKVGEALAHPERYRPSVVVGGFIAFPNDEPGVPLYGHKLFVDKVKIIRTHAF